MTMTVAPIDSAEMSVGGIEGTSDLVVNLTEGDTAPLPYEFLDSILKVYVDPGDSLS